MKNDEDVDSEKMTNIKLVILQLLLQTDQVKNNNCFIVSFKLYLNVKSKKFTLYYFKSILGL